MNITTCLDVLGCERIDHGYHILADEAVVERCRDDGIHFTCCPTSTAMVYGWPDLTTHPINGMLAAGLLVHLNSDDPTMFRTDIGKEYVDFVGQNGYPPEVAKTHGAQRRRRDVARPVRQGVAARRVRGRARRARRELERRRAECTVMMLGRDAAQHRSRAAPRRGTSVAASDEIGRDPVQVWLLGEPWVLVRLPDGRGRRATRLVAFADRCPHRLAPLSAGTVVGDTLQCGYHGWCFDAEGACTDIPAIGGSDRIPPARACHRARPGSPSVGGLVFLAPERRSASGSTSRTRTPTASCTTISCPARARVGAGLMIDNFLDLAHFPFVHAATIGTDDALEVPELTIERDGFGHGRHQHPLVPEPRGSRRRAGHPSAAAAALAALRVPGTVPGRACASTTCRRAAPTCSTSSCSRRTTSSAASTPSLHRDDLDDADQLADAGAYEQKILDEDLLLQERYVDRRLPLDITAEVHVRTDRPGVELRRILADFVAAATAERARKERLMPIDPVDPALRHRAVAAAQGRSRSTCSSPAARSSTSGAASCAPPTSASSARSSPACTSPATRTDALDALDCTGRFVAPGLIDLHVHFESSMLTPGAYAEAVCPRGTTTVFADPHELANVAGVKGVRYAVEASRGLPVRFIVQAPSCVPPQPGLELSGADLFGPDVERMLRWPEVGGLAEVMDMLGVLSSDDRMSAVVAAGLASGKLVSGHAAGLTGARAAGLPRGRDHVGPRDLHRARLPREAARRA